jgi:hypothetical protein
MINIRNEFRISLSVACLGGVIVPMLYKDALGMFTAVCLALGSLLLLCGFAVMPVLIDNKWERVQREHRYFQVDVGAQQEWADTVVRYEKSASAVFSIGLVLLGIGVIGFWVVH